MPQYTSALRQLSGDIFLTDAGVETDLIFNHRIEIREFAAHTLLPTREGARRADKVFRGISETGTRDKHRVHPRQRYLESPCPLGRFPRRQQC
jgi:hypothetical protein